MASADALPPTTDPYAPPSGAPTLWDGDSDVAAEPTPTTDPTRDQARTLAHAAMTAFARPHVAAERWWADFRVYLTPQAVADYAAVDPATVPARRVTGPGRVIATDSDTLARIQIPTDVGAYLVLVTRSPQWPTWRVDRLLPPERRVGDS